MFLAIRQGSTHHTIRFVAQITIAIGTIAPTRKSLLQGPFFVLEQRLAQ
jgi:hypothetical protein